MSVKAHKGLKGLETQNLRDHMTEAELIFTALAELSTRQIAETKNATGMPETASAAKTGGQLAKRARLELEGRTGKKVVSGENFQGDDSFDPGVKACPDDRRTLGDPWIFVDFWKRLGIPWPSDDPQEKMLFRLSKRP